MKFSKEKALSRIDENLFNSYCDDAMKELLDELDGTEAKKVSWGKPDELLCILPGKAYLVKAVDCV